MTTCPACCVCIPHREHHEQPPACCPVAFAQAVRRDLDRLPVVDE